MMKIKLVLMSLSVLVTSACSSDVQVNQQAAKKAPEHVHSSPGKMTAPIEMSYKLSKEKYSVGENIAVEVQLTSRIKKPISSRLNASKNLTLLSGETNWSTSLNKSGVRENQPSLQFLAEKEGKFYLDFVASIEVDGKMMGKAFSIPVQVGNTESEEGQYEIDEKGQKVKVYKLKNDN